MSRQSFKTYQRGQRTQVAEESFTGGQVFTRAPLDVDKSRMLVNYDITSEGSSLSVRKGYNTHMVGLPFNTELRSSFSSDIVISQAKDAIEEDNKRYRLMIANKFSNDDVHIDSNVYLKAAKAELWVTCLDDNNTAYNVPLSPYDIESHNMYSISVSDIDDGAAAYDEDETYNKGDYCLNASSKLCRCKSDGVTGTWDSTKWYENVEPYKSYYYIPPDAEANGMTIDQTKYIARPIGCFAFGNDYYNFNTGGELIRAIYQPADENLGITETFITQKLEPKEITASEASTNGFNMLSTTPFVYSDKYVSGNIDLQGIMLYKDGELITEPVLNTPYKLRCFYTVQQNNKYKIIWDYREVNSNTYTTLETKEITFSEDTPVELSISKFSCPIENAVIRVRAFKYSGSAYETDYENQIAMGVTYVKSPSSVTANRELVNYDLTKATGMVYWKNRIWLYGLSQDPTILFGSDINEPTYFPYPNNIDIFDEPILSCVPFNDNMLVFTNTQVYQLTLDSEGGWTRKTIQNNLDFKAFDLRFVQIVKNMVFFKSGDYYYMIVPKTLSLQNELALAPVSKNIESLLDDLEDNVVDVCKVIYNYGLTAEETLTLVNHYNYLDYEDIHNVYTFKTLTDLFINFVLLYNTVDRTWRTYIYESQDMYYPIKQDATKQGELMSPLYITFNIDSTNTSVVGVQILSKSRTETTDFYVPNNTTIKYITGTNPWQEDTGGISTAFDFIHLFKNYQMLDSGYRKQDIDLNKRYREWQLKINNVTSSTLDFYTEFILDGETRVEPWLYTTEQNIDPISENYGLITITRTPVTNLDVPGGTMLARSLTDLNAWQLSVSKFPEISFWKARLKVSGKGYTPRFRLVGRTEEQYDILGYSWVFRLMYSR